MPEYNNNTSNKTKYSFSNALRKMKNVVCKKSINQYSNIEKDNKYRDNKWYKDKKNSIKLK